MPLILVGAGAFSVAGAVGDWDWFMNSRRARLFVAILGRGGARVFYAILGVLIAVMGVALMFGFMGR